MSAFEGDVAPGGWPRREPRFFREQTATSQEVRDDPDWYQQAIDGGLVRPRIVDTMMSRRTLLFGGSALLAAGAVDYVGKFSNLSKWLDDKVVGQFDYDKAISEARQYFKEKYGINLIVGVGGDYKQLTGDMGTLEKCRASLQILREELQRYPADMITKIGEGKGFEVRVASGLKETVKDKEGKEKQRTLAGYVPGSRPGVSLPIFLNVDESENFQRQTVHHELNHRLIKQEPNWPEFIKKWTELHVNVSKHPYRPLIANIPDHDVPPERYFLSNYAGISAWEDMAACAEWMMTPRLHVQFIRRWHEERNPQVKDILAKKYIRTRDYYNALSGNRIDWQSIINEGKK